MIEKLIILYYLINFLCACITTRFDLDYNGQRGDNPEPITGWSGTEWVGWALISITPVMTVWTLAFCTCYIARKVFNLLMYEFKRG